MPSKWAQKRTERLLREIKEEAPHGLARAVIIAALDEARDSILAQLRNPDEAMVEAVDGVIDRGSHCAMRICRALADVLATPPEGSAPVIRLQIPPLPSGTIAKWEHRDPATLYWLPVVLTGPCGVSQWYVETPCGKTTIIDKEDHAGLVPIAATPLASEE